MVVRHVIKMIIVFVIGVISESYSQAIYLEFDASSKETCQTPISQNKKELDSKFSKTIKGDFHFFRICRESFTFIEGNYCEVKNQKEVKISSINDLYLLEKNILANQVINDSVVHIFYRSEIDSIFIAERIEDGLIKIYAVSWIQKIE